MCHSSTGLTRVETHSYVDWIIKPILSVLSRIEPSFLQKTDESRILKKHLVKEDALNAFVRSVVFENYRAVD